MVVVGEGLAILIEHGVDTLLYHAARHAKTTERSICQSLAAGADPVAKTRTGETPAPLAEANGHETLAAKLRELTGEGTGPPPVAVWPQLVIRSDLTLALLHTDGTESRDEEREGVSLQMWLGKSGWKDVAWNLSHAVFRAVIE